MQIVILVTIMVVKTFSPGEFLKDSSKRGDLYPRICIVFFIYVEFKTYLHALSQTNFYQKSTLLSDMHFKSWPCYSILSPFVTWLCVNIIMYRLQVHVLTTNRWLYCLLQGASFLIFRSQVCSRFTFNEKSIWKK